MVFVAARGVGEIMPFKGQGMSVRPRLVASGRKVRRVRRKAPVKQGAERSGSVYQELFESSPDGILLIDAETQQVLQFNDAACRQLGYTREEFAGLRISDFEASESPDETRQRVQQGIREGQIEFETLQRTRSGDIRNVRVWAKACRFDGRTAFHAVFRDITEHTRLSRALKESEANFKSLFDSAHDAIFVMSGDVLLACNLRTQVLFGGPERDIVGRSLLAFSPRTQPDGQRSSERAAGHIASALAGDPQFFEWRCVRLDGSFFDAEVSLNGVEFRGAPHLQAIVRDVTARKSAEEALRDREKLLRESQALAGLGHYVLDIGTRRWTSSTILDGIFGIDDGFDRTVESWVSLVHPSWQERMSRYLADDVLGQHRRFDMEYQVVRRNDGQVRWVHGIGQLEFDSRGTPFRMLGTISDITERRQTGESLELFRALIDGSNDAIEVVDPETGRYLDVNERGCQDLGYSRQEMLALRVWDVDPGLDPESFASAASRLRHSSGLLLESVHRRKDGSTIPVEVNIKHVQLDRSYFVAVVRNISERLRRDESERLRTAALHAAANAIVITDRGGVIKYVNPAFTRLTGYAEEEALGRNPRDLVKSAKHPPAFYKEFWDAITAGRTWQGEIVNRRKDGSLYTEDQSVTPILDPTGAITHFVAIKEDVTERRQLEARFRQAQKMESVGQLASGVAHDFNNLLTVINGLAEFSLERLRADDPLRADMAEIQNAGRRAAELTRQLLAFSRQQILEPRVLDLNVLIAGMGSLLRRVLGEDIELTIAPASVECTIKADPGQIEQVITNLAVNARDAMPEGGKLAIETRSVDIDADFCRDHAVALTEGPYVLLTMSDSGVGMDEATRTRIFEPFFTTKGPGKGTGLGLATVYGIVKQSHGFIWVYSEVGQGTVFKIYLPATPTEAVSALPPKPAAAPRGGTETILLVEDDSGIGKLATRVLERAGYTVLAAANGEAALRLINEYAGPVHLVLSDVVMPVMSGRRLAELLAQTHPRLKVLYMSGYTSDMVVRHGVLESNVAFLSKPFTAAALAQKVRELLDSPE